MILFAILIILLVVSIIGLLSVPSENGLWLVSMLSAAISGIVLLTLTLILASNRAIQGENLVRIESFRKTVSDARATSLSEMERAAILKQIADWNEWIAAEQYWNGSIWDVFHIDEVMSLEPLR